MKDEKQDCFRIHAASINLGRSLWQSPELTAEESSNITCHSEAYPVSAGEAKAAVTQLTKNQNIERAAPLAGKTAPASEVATVDYAHRLKMVSKVALGARDSQPGAIGDPARHGRPSAGGS